MFRGPLFEPNVGSGCGLVDGMCGFFNRGPLHIPYNTRELKGES